MTRILVVGPSWIGDTVLAQPLFRRLHEKHRPLHLDVLAPPHIMPLLARMPEVAQTLENPFRHGELKLMARHRLGLSLRARRYDQAIVLPNSAKSALVPFLADIPLRVGYRGELRRGLLTDVRRLDERALPLMAERFAWLAQPDGSTLQRHLPWPALRVDLAQGQALIERLGLRTDRPVSVFCPGAEYGPAKRWPARHFAVLAQMLMQDGHQVWLMGGPGDAATAGAILAQAPQAVNLCGRTRLDEAIDLMARATLVVSNDSGLMHVAAALQRPLVALYGSSSPVFTPPLSAYARVMQRELPCSPCFQRECPLGHFDCLNGLSPEQVFAATAFARITPP